MNKLWYLNYSIISYGMECFNTGGFVIDMAKTVPIEEVINYQMIESGTRWKYGICHNLFKVPLLFSQLPNS